MKIISEQCLSTTGTVGGSTCFELITDSKPTIEDIIESQMRLGYHPGGYGGPWNVEIHPKGKTYITTWKCAGSCD